MKKSTTLLLGILMLLSLVLSGCQPRVVEVVKTVEVEVEHVVERTVMVEAEPTPIPECVPVVEPKGNIRPGKLVMSTNATIPPVQFIDASGDLQGMRIELGEEIARRLCLEAEWVNIQFDAMIPGLQGGRWDMINTGLFYTEERAKMMYMIPYELQAISVSSLKGNPDNIQSTEDLAGLRVGVEIGGYEETNIKAINEEQVNNGLEAMQIQTFNTFAEAYQALKAGQLDAVTSVDATAKFYADQGDFDRVIHGLRGSPASMGLVNADLAEAVKAALQSMMDDGTYDELFDKYGVAKIVDWENWDGAFKVWHFDE